MVTPVKTKSLGETISASTEVGKYVNYKPTNGTYTVEKVYSGYTENQTFSTEADLKWRIWDIDNNNLYLISDVATSSYLNLAGYLGYNNGVTLIDNACSSCYSNDGYEGMKVRNLKIEDILKVVTVEPDPDSKYGTPHSVYFEGSYGIPRVWVLYEQSSFEQAIQNRSIAYPLTTATKSSLYRPRPMNTMWYADLDSSSAWINPWYRDLIVDTADWNSSTGGPRYWVSSRAFRELENSYSGYFALYYMEARGLRYTTRLGNEADVSAGGYNGNKLRPFIIIPLSSIELSKSTTSGIDYEISPK